MANIKQYLSDPELESIINNALKKTITANRKVSGFSACHSPETWCIIAIVLYAIAALHCGARFIPYWLQYDIFEYSTTDTQTINTI
jgi:hypothetical protein